MSSQMSNIGLVAQPIYGFRVITVYLHNEYKSMDVLPSLEEIRRMIAVVMYVMEQAKNVQRLETSDAIYLTVLDEALRVEVTIDPETSEAIYVDLSFNGKRIQMGYEDSSPRLVVD